MEKLHLINKKNRFNSHSENLVQLLMFPRENYSVPITNNLRNYLSLSVHKTCIAKN